MILLILAFLASGTRGSTGPVMAHPAGADSAAHPSVTRVTHGQLKEVVSSDSGKIVLVNVWATWCKPCKEELPSLVRLSKEYRDKGLKVVLVSADDVDSLEKNVEPMLKNLQVDVPSYIIADSSDEAFMDGFAPDWSGALPTTFVYDRSGALKETMVGERTYDQFKKSVEKLQPK
jgi:thiol-disulfide isomerase/thioredoxin